MVKLYDSGVYLLNGTTLVPETDERAAALDKAQAKKGTISYGILQAHNTSGDPDNLKIKFDSITSHDLTYVGIIQTARASGLDKFPLPYVLTCCHNSLCAVGGTINEDDHLFGLTACKKYGGIYVPPHIGVMHQYMRETMAGGGKMILGSDSHTRYGALGTMAVGEGGGELVKQILGQTWDAAYPEVVAVYLDGKPNPGIGPQDIAIAIVTAVFKNGYVKNKVMEFVGPGVSSMSTDFRNGVDVMTTETTCLSSVWRTDEDTKAFLTEHGRPGDFQQLDPADTAWYDGCIYIDLSTIHSMIALPFHPSNGFEIRELNANLDDILHAVEEDVRKLIKRPELHLNLWEKVRDGALWADQGTIAGCAGGTYSNIMEAAYLLDGKSTGTDEFALGVYPSSQAVMLDLVRKGAVEKLISAGATIRTAFCGPCFGAGDTPAHGGLSIRHTTRNFPNREGSKPGNGQLAGVALMDARSIAATAANGGRITAADELGYEYVCPEYHYDPTAYEHRVYQGFGKGILNAYEICCASERMFGVALSGGDMRKCMQTKPQRDGVDMLAARGNMLLAARAAGIQCFDTVFTDLDDQEGFEAEVLQNLAMGFDGKSLINPKQIRFVHQVFAPTEKEVVQAEKIVRAVRENAAKGLGVFTVDGKMIDIAFLPGAERTLRLAKACGLYEGDLV